MYFLAILPEGEEVPPPGTPESEDYLWRMKGTCLELTHNYGSETDSDFKVCLSLIMRIRKHISNISNQVNNGNVEPYRGFGHIAVMTPDVYQACNTLETDGVKFQKHPDEGRMKGIAFALDPDGYWIEISDVK